MANNINMPMLYGEGKKAFIRLQEEIMKVSDDHSLFAWKSSNNHGGLLATSPAAFFNSGQIIPSDSSNTLSGAITVSNKGIHLKLHITDRTIHTDCWRAILPCTEKGQKVAIYISAISKEYVERARSFSFGRL